MNKFLDDLSILCRGSQHECLNEVKVWCECKWTRIKLYSDRDKKKFGDKLTINHIRACQCTSKSSVLSKQTVFS